MEVYTHDLKSLTESANSIKEAVLFALEKDGLLNRPAQEIAANYAVVLHKKGWLGRFFKRLAGDFNEDTLAVDVLKQCGKSA